MMKTISCLRNSLSLLATITLAMGANACSDNNKKPIDDSRYRLTLTTSDGGSISSGRNEYAAGEEVTVTATPDANYYFGAWYENESTVSENPAYTFLMPSRNVTLRAAFNENNNENTSMKVNIIIGDHTVTATMEDNAAAQDFLSRLPLDVMLEDYNNITEKIFYPSPALTLSGVTRGCAPVPGDITIYVPWGNVAIFCRNWSRSNDLIKIGHIDGHGIEALSIPDDIQVRFERQ